MHAFMNFLIIFKQFKKKKKTKLVSSALRTVVVKLLYSPTRFF